MLLFNLGIFFFFFASSPPPERCLLCPLRQLFKDRIIMACLLSRNDETPMSSIAYSLAPISKLNVGTHCSPSFWNSRPSTQGTGLPLLPHPQSNHVLPVRLSCPYISLPLGSWLTCPEVDTSSKLDQIVLLELGLEDDSKSLSSGGSHWM